MCTFSKEIGKNIEKEICLLNKESLFVHRCEIPTMAIKCEIFMNCSNNFIGICKKLKQLWLPNMECLKNQRCEGTNMASKNIWGCQFNTSWTLVFCLYKHVCTISKGIGINKEEEICLPNKESIIVHSCEITTMGIKCEMFMNCSKTWHLLKKTYTTAKQGIIKR